MIKNQFVLQKPCLLYLRWDERPAGFPVTLSVLLLLCKVAAVTVVDLIDAVIVWWHYQRLVCKVIKKPDHASRHITHAFRFNPGSSCNITDHNSKMDRKRNASKCKLSGGTWLLGSVSCVYGSVPVSQFTVRSSTATTHTIIIQKNYHYQKSFSQPNQIQMD